MSATLPRVLVLTDVHMTSSDVGGIWQRTMCSFLPPSALAVCHLTLSEAAMPSTMTEVTHVTVRRPREHGFHRLGKVGLRATRWGLEQFVRRVGSRTIARRAAEFGRRHDVQLVLAVLNGTTVISAAPAVARLIGVPLVSLVWDPPEYRLRHAWGLTGRLLAGHIERFGEAMRASERCAVMSDGMAREYDRRYGVRTVRMHLGVPRRQWRDSGRRTADDGDFVIAFSGSLYAREEWEALLAALDRAGWRLGGRPVRVKVLSGHFEALVSGPVRIDFRGWQTPESALEELAEADLCYLPYWFDARYGDMVRMSFPSKLPPYIAAGVPVFYHGPEQSSAADFIRRYPLGALCHSREPEEIGRLLEHCATDPQFRADAVRAGRRALEEELDLAVFRRRFADLLGVPEDALLPGEA